LLFINLYIFFLNASLSLPFTTGNFIDLGQEKKNTKEYGLSSPRIGADDGKEFCFGPQGIGQKGAVGCKGMRTGKSGQNQVRLKYGHSKIIVTTTSQRNANIKSKEKAVAQLFFEFGNQDFVTVKWRQCDSG